MLSLLMCFSFFACNSPSDFCGGMMMADAWADGDDRWFIDVPEKDEFVVAADIQVRFSGRSWKGAGTAIPVFALRSADDFGVGEFYDLKKMVDWAASTG